MKRIEFYKHNINRSDYRNLKRTLKSIFLTTGPVTKRFENELADYLGVKNVVGVSSCTAGLFLSLKALGIKEGDEVITTPLTFVATANSILYCNARPVFVDVNEETGLIDIDKIEQKINENTKAIIPVHLYGFLCDMERISKIAQKHSLKVVEDSAHSVEGEIDGKKAGLYSDAASFSFYATKNITSGEGGAVATNNDEIADKIRVLRLHGMDKSAEKRYTEKFVKYDVPVLGYKFNLSDIQSALLINQLKRIDKVWVKKDNIYKYYIKRLSEIEEVNIPKKPDNVKSGYHIFTITVPSEMRDYLLNYLQEHNIGVAVNYTPVHLLKYYRERFGYKEGDFPVTEKIGKSTITLPFYAKLKFREVDYIVKMIKQGVYFYRHR